MRIISFNANGIRSAAKKGFFTWLSRQRADVVCIQETKAQAHQLTDPIFHPKGYDCTYHDAEKKGYSGTALYCRKPPKKLQVGLGIDWIDREGRYIEAQYDSISIASLYLPSGTSGEERQAFKYRMMDEFLPFLQKRRRKRTPLIVSGDWNIVHTEADIKNWKSNQKNSGCLPEERAWLGALFEKHRYADAFRALPQKPHEYTWWSARGQARANNVGWRIDYQVVSDSLAPKVSKTRIYRDKMFSDHAPLIIDYDVNI